MERSKDQAIRNEDIFFAKGWLRRIQSLAFLLCFSLLPANLAWAEWTDLLVLCYHDVRPYLDENRPPDFMPIPLADLVSHFDRLRELNYTVISLDDLLAARANQTPLPPRAVLLTFDDGYRSFYELVFPLLKAYQYPALLSLPTSWLEAAKKQAVVAGSSEYSIPSSAFLTWREARAMVESGLVELASHSHALHLGHPANPQMIQQPAAAALLYDSAAKRYETAEEFKTRLQRDFRYSADLIEKNTGVRPRVAVWPYGAYTNVGLAAILEVGYQLTASLDADEEWPVLGRFLVTPGLTLDQILEKRAVPSSPIRAVQVDLDYINDPDPLQVERNFSALLDRLEILNANTVFLQAFADPDGDGSADALYFPNRHLPLKADLFNYAAWQISRRLGIQVYAWLPTLSFKLPDSAARVEALEPGKESGAPQRLSPFCEDNIKIINEIYEDLAAQASFDGLLFHDDAMLGDYEDASPAGLAWARGQGFSGSLADMRHDQKQLEAFTRLKSLALIHVTHELREAAAIWRPHLQTARNLYAQVVRQPEAETWYAQNFADFLEHYDYAALMAMPYMEEADNPETWLNELAKAVQQQPDGPEKTIFELQTVDWRPATRGPLPSQRIAEQMELLLRQGMLNMAYYPDDPILGHPDVKVLASPFSFRNQ